MTAEELGEAVNRIILDAKDAGLDDGEIIAELEGILMGLKGEE